jgi:hypothetical protein
MKLIKTLIEKLWEKALVLVGALFVLLPVSPLNMPYTFRDSGVFLYFGWRILNGELPYRDLWDHKPPVILYLNALGLAISDNSRWGVWVIELAALFFAAYIGYVLIKKIFGFLPAALSLLIWLLSLVPLLQGGNFTTEYALILQFTALWLVYHANRSQHPLRIYFLIGLFGGISFFTKQTTIGVWLAIALYLTAQRLFARQALQWVREMFSILLGGVSVIAFVAAFWGVQGALPQFWDAAFAYNFVYSSYGPNGLAVRVDSVLEGLKPLLRTRILHIALLGYVGAVAYLFFKRKDMEKASPLLLIVLLDFPIELMLIGTPRKTYPPYYITALPALAVLSGMAFWMLFDWVSRWKIPAKLNYVIAIGLAGFLVYTSFYNYMNQLYTYRKQTKNETIIEYIKENTIPDDTILLWGAETSINYFTERRSPTRYVYQYPLHKEGYTNETIIVEFLDDLLQNKPKYIIDTGTQDPMYQFPLSSETIVEKTSQLEGMYCPERRIDNWTLYIYSEDGCQ